MTYPTKVQPMLALWTLNITKEWIAFLEIPSHGLFERVYEWKQGIEQ